MNGWDAFGPYEIGHCPSFLVFRFRSVAVNKTLLHDNTLPLLGTAQHQHRSAASGRLDFNHRAPHRVALVAAQALGTATAATINRASLSRFLLSLRSNGTARSSSKTPKTWLARQTPASREHVVVVRW